MAKRKKSYRPRKLRRREVGAERCDRFHGMKLCVQAKQYGYAAWLEPKSGGMALPVPTGRARTVKSAMSAAKQFLRRAAARQGKRK